MSRRPKLRGGSARTIVESSAAHEKTQIDEEVMHEEKAAVPSQWIAHFKSACPPKFLNEVDSATVYWNALEELTTYKYVIRGEGQIRE
jgi:gamma-glutamyl phosphate reductase